MSKTIFEEMGDVCERQGDYYIPSLTLPDKRKQTHRHMGKAAFALYQRI